ncbi:MAG: UDP-glucose 4-epimerase GalE [bacterium]
MKRVLVTGGAGYIGSHTAWQLVAAGHEVVVLDDLSSGHRWAAPTQAAFVRGDVADRALLHRILDAHRINAVIHFAAHVVVPESVAAPAKYYRNNVVGSLNLIESCIAADVGALVFSSSAAVYGAPDGASDAGIKEDAATAPINPYGASKLITEWTLRDLAAAASGFRFVALRYFNVAGARLDGALGQATPRATHLIKAACEAACGARDGLRIFGDDYPTADGTCVRDYIHVEDLARAHLAAFDYLDRGGDSIALNCGYGRGHSVAEVVACVKAVSGSDFAVAVEDRRAGDPPALVADNALIREHLQWQPQHDDLAVICDSAYRWERTLMQRRG